MPTGVQGLRLVKFYLRLNYQESYRLGINRLENQLNGLVKRNSVYKWLEQDLVDANLKGLPNFHKPAIEMLDTKDEAKLVLEHPKAYISYFKVGK